MELDEVLSLLTLQLKITVEWIDSRLDYVDLKNYYIKNKLTPEDIEKIWIPTLMFVNTKEKPETDFRNQLAHVSIKVNEGLKNNIMSQMIILIHIFFIVSDAKSKQGLLDKVHNTINHKGKDW